MAKNSANRIQEVGWPSRRMKSWPVAVDWTPDHQKKKVGPVGYQKVVGTVRALFNDSALGDVLARFQDYCFQQGGMSNANPRDRTFFFDALTHDMVFFQGDQGHPVVDDLPIDPKIYNALPQMQASHFDLWRIDKKGIAGGLEGVGLLSGRPLKAGARVFKGPGKGAYVLARIVQIGRGYFLDEPWMLVDQAFVGDLEARFEAELAATQERFPDLVATALLKVAGYHLYETVAALELRRVLEEGLPAGVQLAPRMIRYQVRKRRELFDIGAMEGAKVVEEEGGKASLVLIDAAPEVDVHRSLREVMVSRDDRELLLISWLDTGDTSLESAIEAQLPKHTVRTEEAMELDNLYRSLRHMLTAR